MRIGYLTLGRDDFGYGLALVLDEISKQHEVYRITPRTARLVDWVVFSAFWWEHIYLIADFLRKAGIRLDDTSRPRIVVGGIATQNPVPFLSVADYVVVGDGEGVLPRLLSGEIPDCVLTKEKTRVSANTCDSLRPFSHETNGIGRIEIARGCKFACRFCGVTWWKPYRELGLDGVREAIRNTSVSRVSLFAPEPTIHSHDDRITVLAHNYGKVRVDSDVRLDRVLKRDDSVPRVGIEGISERLRRLVGKPYRNEQIVDAVRGLITSGRRGMFWYIILDLPGESEDDWMEFKTLLERVGSLDGAERFVLKPSPSVFMPAPHTPMQYEGIHWDRDYRAKWASVFGRGDERQWGVIMAERTRIFSPEMRVLSMLSTRGGNEFGEVERALTASGSVGISAGRVTVKSKIDLLRVIDKFGGPERWCGKMTPESAPWKIVTAPACHPNLATFQTDRARDVR